ncbi:MAG: glycosyltransferase family 4 protein [Deltaproteobacteria bacterium]|nr:glycosyltransferase family 4 protein [Deltaproteobacteria bacterium]
MICSTIIKILYILDNMQSDDCGRALAGIINGLSRERYEIYLACRQDSYFYNSINGDVQHIPLDFSKSLSPGPVFKLAGIIRRNRIRVIHSCGIRADLHGRLASLISRRAVYVSTITLTKQEPGTDRSQKIRPWFLTRFPGIFVDRFISSSDLVRKYAIDNIGIRPDRVIRIYSGVDTEKFSPSLDARKRIRAELNITDDTILIGAVGSLVWQKGFEFIIKCMPIFTEANPDVKVLIAGEGPFREHIIMHSHMNGMEDRLILTGFREDMEDILSAVDILVIPSLMDEFPMIALEGMSMAKPIVGTRVEGIKELITDSETGLLVLSWNADALGKAISRLIKDRGLAERLGKNARERVEEEFSVEKMVVETERLYQSLCEEKGLTGHE